MDMGHHFLYFFQGSVAADTNPALFDAAPYSAIDSNLFKYFRHIALIHGGNPTIVGAGATAHIQAGAGDSGIDLAQDLAIEGLFLGLRMSTMLAVPAFLTGDFVSGFYADIPITIHMILLCQGFGFEMIAVFAILTLQAFSSTSGIGHGVPIIHTVTGGCLGLGQLVTAMGANLLLNMFCGAVAHLGYLPIAISMANGGHFFRFVVIAVFAILTLLTHFGAGRILHIVPITELVTQRIYRAHMAEIAAYAIPMCLTVFGTGGCLNHMPVAQFMTQRIHSAHFAEIAVFTIPMCFTGFRTGGSLDGMPVPQLVTQRIHNAHLIVIAVFAILTGLTGLRTGGCLGVIPIGIDVTQSLNRLGFKQFTADAIPTLFTFLGTGGILGVIPIAEEMLYGIGGTDFKMIAVFAILTLFTVFGQRGCQGLIPVAHGVAGCGNQLFFIVLAMQALAAICAIFGTGGSRMLCPGAHFMAGGRHDLLFVHIAIFAVLPVQTILGTGGQLFILPLAHHVIGQIRIFYFIVIAVNAILARMTYFHAGGAVSFIPVAHGVAGERQLLGLDMVTNLAMALLLTVGHAGGIGQSLPCTILVVLKLIQLGTVKIGIIQRDPTAGVATPHGVVHHFHRQQLYHIALIQGVQPAVLGAGTAADIQVRVGHRDLRGVRQHHIIVHQHVTAQANPTALFQTAPPFGEHLIGFYDQHFLTLFQVADLGVSGFRAIIDRDAVIAHNGHIQRCFVYQFFLGLLFGAGCTNLIKIGGVFQADPALIDLAPQAVICTGGHLGHHHSFTAHSAVDHRVSGAGAAADIQYITGNGSLHTIGNLDAAAIILTIACLPVGIQGFLVHILIQVCNLHATHRLGIPTQEGVTFAGCADHRHSVHIGIIALGHSGELTAIGIIEHIAVIGGDTGIVVAVHEDLGLSESAAHQTSQIRTASSTPLAHQTDQGIAGGTIANCLLQITVAQQPSTTTVVGDGQHGVKLMLIIGQIVAIDKIIDLLLILEHFFLKQFLSRLNGNTGDFILLQVFIGATITIANGPLGVVPFRNRRKAFH